MKRADCGAGAAGQAVRAGPGRRRRAEQKAGILPGVHGHQRSDEALCTCKADAAMTLIDERIMGYVIDSA